MSTIDRLKCPACGMPTIPDDGHNTPDMALCNFCYEQEDLETMSTHTPGPWKTGTGKFTDQVFERDAEGEDWGHWLICETGGNTANARLIASAPDLLVALKDARERLEYLEPEYFDDESHEVEWRDYLAKTDDLIAKAEGMR